MKIDSKFLEKIWISSDTHGFHVNITRGTTSWGNSQPKMDLNHPTGLGIDPSIVGDSSTRSGNELKVRDFDTPEQMTQQLADNFNSVIPEDGILFHLGDWSFAGEPNIERFRKMLNVKEIHLITGNHDLHLERGTYDHLFASRQKYLELQVGKLNFVLFHFPIASWNGVNKGWFHLHGHQHWVGEQKFGDGKMMDVGVDGNNLFPYHLPDVVELLKDRRKVDPNDHHTV